MTRGDTPGSTLCASLFCREIHEFGARWPRFANHLARGIVCLLSDRKVCEQNQMSAGAAEQSFEGKSADLRERGF